VNTQLQLIKAHFTFFAELNDFLPRHQKNTTFTIDFEDHQTIKHLIESLGVPHTEVGRILINGHPAEFSCCLQDGDGVTVYPADSPLAGEPSFVLDNHLGQLATYLRMLGFDALYRNDYQDDELAHVAIQEGRILLTRDRRLLMRKVITLGYCPHQSDPRQQAVEVLRRFNLFGQVRPFQRCLRCNAPLQPVSKQDVLDRLEPLTKQYYNEFHLCPSCNQVYWKGSHFERMQQMIAEMAREP
jgi:uncharacterized protein with PIN domain